MTPLRRWLPFLVCAIAAAIAVSRGPPLGEHEALVALVARDMIQSGDYLLPQCMDTPFLVKPPLMYWAVAAASRILPAAAGVGVSVSDFSSRIPSVIATALTAWIIFRLGRSMFDAARAWVASFVYVTCLGAWLYAVNATVEALLTLMVTWAFAEFWWASQARNRADKARHLLLFYVALGLAMLAKAPMPLAIVALPLIVFWWFDRPLRAWIAGGFFSIGHAVGLGIRQAWPRLRIALSGLGLWWGVPLVLLFIGPWMFYVARHYPFAWSVWQYEYLGRAAGYYPGMPHSNAALYYLPIALGLAIPWTLSLPESLASPYLTRYRRDRRALVYLWCWAVVGIIIMSSTRFKKPYYILPVIPAVSLLLSPVLGRLFLTPSDAVRRRAKPVVALIIASLALVIGILWRVGLKKYPEAWHDSFSQWAVPASAALALAGFSGAGLLFIRGRSRGSLVTVGLTSVLVFTLGWGVFGPALEDVDECFAVARRMDELKIPADAPLMWLGGRPDPRIDYYTRRAVRPLIDTDRLIAEHAGKWDDDTIKLAAARHACDLLNGTEPVYVLFNRAQLNLVKEFFDIRVRELFSVDHDELGNRPDEWVVVTNLSHPPSLTSP